MEQFWPIILDAAIVLIAIFFIWLGYRRGFVRTAVYVVGYVVSAAAASWVSQWLGNKIAQWCRAPIVSYTTQQIAGSNDSLTASVEQMYENAPLFLQSWMARFGTQEELAAQISSSAQEAAQSAAEGIAEYVIMPLVASAAGVILFLVLFFICLFLVRWVAGLCGILDYIPVVGGLNHLAGGLVGILQALLAVFFFVLLISIVLSCVAGGVKIVERTYVFQWLNGLMPFFRFG